MNADERRFDRSEMSQLTERVIRCAFAVSNTLGCGFLEKVYENALAHELRKAGIPTVKDRLVQTAALLILEPIFEADFLDCSYGFCISVPLE